MREKNLERMIKLAEDFFETKNDPAQISVDEEVMAKLLSIHPSTRSEERDENGPIAWILVIPTTLDVMNRFIARTINEQELLDETKPGGRYEAIYLCSALVLPEFRGKGLARRLATNAIVSIRAEHPIQSLYVWSFSDEGEHLASAIAKDTGLPLYRRPVPSGARGT